MAVVFPLLMMVLLAIISFGRAYNIYSTIVRAAQDGVSVASTFQCGGPCNNATATPAEVVLAVTNAMAASKVDANPILAYQPTPAPLACPGITPSGCTLDASNITICKNVQLNPSSSGPKQCGSIVSFQYPYQFSIPFVTINMQSIRLTAVAERQMEN